MTVVAARRAISALTVFAPQYRYSVGNTTAASAAAAAAGIFRYSTSVSPPEPQSQSQPQPQSISENCGSKDREPVESVLQRILEPDHARSIGLSSANDQQIKSNNTVTALVPLNIIYLPPPKWHQPMKPLMVRLREAKNNNRLNDPDAKSKSHTTDSPGEGDAGPTPERTSNIWLKSSQASNGILRWLRHFAATASTKQTSTGTADTKGSATDRIMSGAFGRAVESSRQTLNQIRGLPKDDDWVTWLGKALNQITGYNRISDLKNKVEESSSEFKAARHDLDKIKELHARTVQERIANQREINSLLQRKHLWNEDDVARFTGLYKDEHQADMTELSASESLKEAEALVDRRYDQLVETIRERYHEEQIWSDKIRRASTYGTWAVLFMNILALFMAQAIFEPRKRRKIVAGVDEKLTAAIGDQQARIDEFAQGMLQRQAEHERSIAGVAGHLANVTAALGVIATRQEAEMSATADRLLGSPLPMLSSSSTLPRGAADNGLIASVLAGDDGGYSDSELDMYYSQAAAAQRQRSADSSWKWRSMLWKAARPSKHSDASDAPSNESEQNKERAFTRAEAGQLALETAAVTGILAAAVASLYFSS